MATITVQASGSWSGDTPDTSSDSSDIPPNLESAILSREGSKPDSISPKGAVGRGQIMPATAVPYLFPNTDPNDPAAQYQAHQLLLNDDINSKVRKQIIGDLWSKYHDPIAVMVAYNAGPNQADEWLASGKNPSTLPGETQRYIGVGSSGKAGSPGWFPSPDAIDAENRKSNSSLRYMDPLQYLSLLPPLEDDEASRAKKENLNQSLSKGDNIESLPSLEVEPRGDDLHVVDSDGRNRAQAAVDAGVDQIPVAINGASEDKDYKNLKGKKTLLYAEFKRVVPISASEQAQKIAPIAFQGAPVQQQQSPATLPQVSSGPNPSVFDPAQAAATNQAPIPTKPDFYPQIVAGINNDIINPRGIGYRGTGVPNETTNATAGSRIAAANANSSGQVGLPPSSPSSSLSSILSELNPISSAQAAEPSGPVTVSASGAMPSSGVSVQAEGDYNPQSKPSISGPFTVPQVPGLESVGVPLANALMSPVTNLAADVSGLVSGQPRWAGGALPTMEGYQQARDNALARYNGPETPGEQALSTILSSPFMALGWAAKKILEAGLPTGSSVPSIVAPYAQIALDVAAPLALGVPQIRNALAKPVAASLGKVVKTPETRAALAVNKVQPQELAAGGLSVSDMRNKLAQARSAGIPLTPADLLVPAGPQAKLLGYSLEHSPEATAGARQFLEQRTEGTRPRPGAEPVGGTLERMTKETEKHFGAGSARDAQTAIDKSLKANTNMLNNELKKLANTETSIKNHISLTKPDPQLAALRQQRSQARTSVANLRKQIDRDTKNLNALSLGQKLFRDSFREEDIKDFLRKRGSQDELDNFKLGMGDAIRHEYRRVRALGREPDKTALPQNIRNKVSAAFGNNPKEADDYLNSVDLEDKVSTGTRNILKDISREGYLSDANKRQLHLFAEALGHFALAHPILGGALYGAKYWALRSARLLTNYLTSGGGVAPRRFGREITNALLNPNAKLATSGNGLLQVPARSAASQVNINALARASVPVGVLSATTNNQQPLENAP
jgi:hypothetical protein